MQISDLFQDFSASKIPENHHITIYGFLGRF